MINNHLRSNCFLLLPPILNLRNACRCCWYLDALNKNALLIIATAVKCCNFMIKDWIISRSCSHLYVMFIFIVATVILSLQHIRIQFIEQKFQFLQVHVSYRGGVEEIVIMQPRDEQILQ